ncbi:unnamed protein product [Pneumocystis jirovecii]|uniref:HORMA domain-containing protein n=1 Tax=Pneumocystis jirovecii TaxID=42068 RepID=L0PAZ2_PNEJI|nr:unnamed protein product [Pneumocystis jirovecii]
MVLLIDDFYGKLKGLTKGLDYRVIGKYGNDKNKKNVLIYGHNDNNENKENKLANEKNNIATEKSEKEIHTEIQAIIRQITASVTFLPQLEGQCTFNVLVYTDYSSEVPEEWGDSDAHEVDNAEQIKLRSFSTDLHKVDLQVAYKLADD